MPEVRSAGSIGGSAGPDWSPRLEAQHRTSAPYRRLLPPLYRALMRVSRRHGLRTLARIDHRISPRGQVICLPTGSRLFVPPDPHFIGYVTGHESHITNLITTLVRPGDSCVDVGANIGYFSSMMAGRCGPRGCVLAYEPERRNIGWLKVNAALAAEQGLRVLPVHAAVSDHDGTVTLIRGAESTLHRIAEADGEGERVPCVSLAADVAARQMPLPIRLLKIDVEGHEGAVLRGAIDLVRGGDVNAIVLEVAPGAAAQEIEEVLPMLRPASVTCWLDGEWQPQRPAAVPYLTDMVLRF